MRLPVLLAFVVLSLSVACGGEDPSDPRDTRIEDETDISVISPDGVIRPDAPDVPDVEPVDAADTAEPDTGDDIVEADAPSDADVETCDGAYGCPCEVGQQCDSGWCIAVPGEPSMCTQTCDETACPDGLRCAWQSTPDGTRAQICVATPRLFCLPCTRNADCGVGGACVEKADGTFCAPACGPSDTCSAGSRCGPVSDINPQRVCVTPGNNCIGCTDLDGDGYIERTRCFGTDCADNDATVHPGTDEMCNRIDEDCDNIVDEGWDLQVTTEHCGACGQACPQTRGIVACEDAACVVSACDPGYSDCNNSGDDGCEFRLTGGTSCGVCPGPDNIAHGNPCGTCGSGTWQCSNGSRECVGDLGEDAYNSCGGCAPLEAEPGGKCGTCESGDAYCNGPDAITCIGDLEDGALNACGGCSELDTFPGFECGTCGSGTLVCDAAGELECVGDAGEDAYNACGGCTIFSGTIGGACGGCDTGVLTCDGPEEAVCVGEDPSAVNACGGCSELPFTVGAPCGACNDGTFACTDTESVVCADATILGPGDECPDPTCEGRIEGRLGEACDDDNGCCNGNCGEFPPSNGVCTQSCSRFTSCSTATQSMFCGLSAPRECTPNDYGAPCADASQCVDGLCIEAGPEGSACTWRCELQSDCASNMVCATYGSTRACSTMGEPCTDNGDCRTGLCLNGDTGAGYCSAPCRNGGTVATCPAGYACGAIEIGVFVCQRP